jgi:hypothetical protein
MSGKPTRRHLLGGLLAALLGSWRRRLPAAPPRTPENRSAACALFPTQKAVSSTWPATTVKAD